MEDLTNKYLIDDSSFEMFDNITRFMKNAALKSSKELYNAENAVSSLLGEYLIKYYTIGLTNEEINKLIETVNAYNKKIKDKLESIKDEDLLGSDLLYKIDNLEGKDELEKNTIKEYYKERLKKSLQIFIYNYSEKCGYKNGDATKRKASALESKWAENGEQIIFFDLRHIMLKPTESGLSALYEPADILNSNKNDDAGVKHADLLIMYKELNPLYRNIFRSKNAENALSLLDLTLTEVTEKGELVEVLNPVYFNDIAEENETLLKSNLQELFRNLSDPYELLITKGYESDLFRYLRANAFKARRAEESSLIVYYYGDNYDDISDGYGNYGYEKEEIQAFLDIYEETRQYYYKVLLNYSFINESDYEHYEKFFLTCVSIERFLSYKLKKLKDIDYMNREDISNFLQSFGLKGLDDRLGNDNNFINREKYLKKLLHSHLKLLHEKGSKKVVDTLINLFNYSDSDITITKYLLVNNTEKEKLQFIETTYSSDNLTKEIDDCLKNASTDYNNFLDGSDKYWDIRKVPEKTVLETDLGVTETKYLGLKNTKDYGYEYFKTRFMIGVIDYLSTNENKLGINSSIVINYEGNDYELIKVFDAIKILYKNIFPNSGNSISYSFNKLNEITYTNLGLINENGILKLANPSDFYTSYSNNLLEGFDQYLLGLSFLVEGANYDALGSKLDSNSNYKKLTDTQKFYIVIESILKFPLDYVNGKLTYETFKNINSNFQKLLDKIFEKVFISEINTLEPSTAKIGEELANALLENYNNNSVDALIELLSILHDGFAGMDLMEISFSLTEDENREIEFIKTIVEYFISYTTELKNTKIEKMYDNESERYIISDNIDSIGVSKTMVDSIFYDEKFILEEEGNSNEGTK